MSVKYAFSKSLPFSMTRVRNQLVVSLRNSGLIRRDRDKNVHCSGMAG